MLRSNSPEREPGFTELSLRFLVGLITFLLPILVVICSNFSFPKSISGSYWTGARDPFVGSLFMIATLLFAIQGHNNRENWIAKLGSLAAIIAAVCPTSCDQCPTNSITYIHFLAGAVLFSVIAYFCLGPFRKNAANKNTKKSLRRVKFYTVCGRIIIGCIVMIGISDLLIPGSTRDALKITFIGELIALWAFSCAWLVASRIFNFVSEKNEKLDLVIDIGNLFRLEF